ncbi:MAG TPA: ester cyclase [Candidatus Kapabacteria bacterium]|nr:ester cyclase [Candidatus Kapabacteria bacterium]
MKKEGGAAMGANATADSMKAAYKAFSDDWDAGKSADFDKYMTADAIDHNPMPGQKPGLQGVKDMAAMLKASFPDMKSTIQDMRVDGDILTARFTVTGTNTGPMMHGMPATNKKMTDVMGIDQLRWSNGKFVEHWGVFDVMSMMNQLGMMPPPPGAGAPPPAGGDKKMDDKMMEKK